MNRKIKIDWEVDDGYAGKSRPHYITLDEDYIGCSWEEWDELTEDEQEETITDIIQAEFEEKITWFINSQTDEK